MAANTTWTVRLTGRVTAPAGAVITENAATMADAPDPNLANNTATVSLTVHDRGMQETNQGLEMAAAMSKNPFLPPSNGQ
jgi:hypothetical protein